MNFLTHNLFDEIEDLETDFFGPREKNDFNENISDIESKFNFVFNRDKCNLTSKTEEDYQSQYQGEVSNLTSYFIDRERIFNNTITEINKNFTILGSQINIVINISKNLI